MGILFFMGQLDPVPGDGVNGNFFINTTTWYIFGPKFAGSWPGRCINVGPAGPPGPAGADGADLAPPFSTERLTRQRKESIMISSSILLHGIFWTQDFIRLGNRNLIDWTSGARWASRRRQ